MRYLAIDKLQYVTFFIIGLLLTSWQKYKETVHSADLCITILIQNEGTVAAPFLFVI